MKSAAVFVSALVLSLGILCGCNPKPGTLVDHVPSPPPPKELAPLPELRDYHNPPKPKPEKPDPAGKPDVSAQEAPHAEWVAGNPDKWTHIILHHSADDIGDAELYDRLHRQRGWDELGYHFVIGNGTRDGLVEVGSRWKKQKHGAHCRVSKTDANYWNQHGIGICLVGNFNKHVPSERQMQSAAKLVGWLMIHCNIPRRNVLGHGQVPGTSTACPGKRFSYSDLFRRIAKQQSK